MESQPHTIAEPSKPSSTHVPPKVSVEPGSSGRRSRPKESANTEKSSKTKEKRTKKHTSLPRTGSMRSGLDHMVKLAHNRTKHVKSKLVRVEQIFRIPPEVDIRTTDLTEEDVLKEIDRLHKLLEQMWLQKQKQKQQRKYSNIRQSLQSDYTATSVDIDDDEDDDDNDDDDDDEDEDNNDEDDHKSVKLAAADGHVTTKKKKKTRRRQIRMRKRTKLTDEQEVLALYEKHINQLVCGENKDANPKYADLQFKLGDDLDKLALKCVEADLGQIIEGEIRVSAKNNHQAFISFGDEFDAVVLSMAARRYAMDGDLVKAFMRNLPENSNESPSDPNKSVVAIEPIEKQRDEKDEQDIDANESTVENEVETLMATQANHNGIIRRQAFVISIKKELGCREFVGSISFKGISNLPDGKYYKFKPRNLKAPLMYIPVESGKQFVCNEKSDDILGFLFIARITEFKEAGRCIGKLIEPVGKCGNLESEIKAVLLNNKLTDVKPFEERFEQMWTEPTTITQSDTLKREDLRKECIFTIDPLTARDLDDAMSCKTLENGCFEIGVHISDVTQFLEECSELDELVKLRATSIYLVNEVIHMLPKTLCMKCSLLPDEDKFAFSVFWVINEKAEVISTRYTRSIIRSCTQLAYEHAQKIIDNPNEHFTMDDFPTIFNGFTVSDIVERVHKLNSLATIMREKRFENGSLSIEKPHYYFQFDPKTGEPIGYEIAQRLTANFLIEEFMLLANQSVAQFIYKCFPEISFLRNHLPPKPSAVKNLKAKLSAVGVELDMSTSKTIFEGLKTICGASTMPDVLSAGMNYLLTKPMMRAKYFCSENVESESELFHYALAVPIYTHFTSPIRRYPDILVHRLLSAALEYTPPPKRTTDELHILAKICNDQKYNAKSAGEESADLFFQRYVKAQEKVVLRAVITDIYRNMLEVITLETGHTINILFKLQKTVVDASKAPNVILISEKNSSKPPVELKIFSPLDVAIVSWDGKLTGFFISPDWEQRVRNDVERCAKKQARLSSRKVLISTSSVDGKTLKPIEGKKEKGTRKEKRENKQVKAKQKNNDTAKSDDEVSSVKLANEKIQKSMNSDKVKQVSVDDAKPVNPVNSDNAKRTDKKKKNLVHKEKETTSHSEEQSHNKNTEEPKSVNDETPKSVSDDKTNLASGEQLQISIKTEDKSLNEPTTAVDTSTEKYEHPETEKMNEATPINDDRPEPSANKGLTVPLIGDEPTEVTTEAKQLTDLKPNLLNQEQATSVTEEEAKLPIKDLTELKI